ncbi:hypothetical protein [Arthrobacter sp. MYb222]|uniref:hypothetical protein n=1 Tax=Arthrobacter sp. MYb222 TaxID=1848599 RepID=UPI000CFD2F3B|nr:hypothetical protein [Arthrobacter sp. MYb222]PQZ90632.1 hypothetical protein CQ016_01545 [Arthrobacter sp. MYb222]
MKKMFYAAFALMVLGAAVLILTVPALSSDPGQTPRSIAVIAGTVFMAAASVVVLLKKAATQES